MAQLSSPGVAVTVIDESFYTPAAPGTTPLIIVASAENKANGSNTGTAPGTLAANAGKTYLLTSQKDLADTFGTPTFKTDANNNPIHAGEQNEYGLQTAYSYLGVSNRAYVIRADLDTDQLDAASEAPAGEPVDGQYWLDTANSKFGIFQWNSAEATVTTGQTFINQVPTIITEASKLEAASGGNGFSPKTSIGAVGDYAITLYSGNYALWFKKAKTATVAGTWVAVGSTAWRASWPVVQGTVSSPALASGDAFVITINGTDEYIYTGHTTLSSLVTDIMTGAETGDAGQDDAVSAIPGVTAAIVNNRLELYSTGVNVVLSGSALVKVGMVAGTYRAPTLQISTHTVVPNFKRLISPSTYNDGNPTGSLWVKTTEPNLGSRWRVKVYSEATGAWIEKTAPIYQDSAYALKGLDSTGGGINLAQGALYIKSNIDELTASQATFKVYARRSAGATTITSDVITSFTTTTSNVFTIQETVKGKETLSDTLSVSFTGSAGVDGFIAALTAKLADATWDGLPITSRITVSKTSTGAVVITHNDGGEIVFDDTTGTAITDLFTVFNVSNSSTTVNFYAGATAGEYVASLWSPYADITTSATSPVTEAADGQLWYSSLVDEVDIMINNGTTWVGYQNYTWNSGQEPWVGGPIVAATKPKLNPDGGTLRQGDLWIDTSDIENYPSIYKYNVSLQKWIAVDATDQTTDDGILFADARWAVNGGTATAQTSSTIVELLDSNFLDFDAPDPALYPTGMLLWNLRRSGFNVKKFVRDYVDVNGENARFNNGELMTDYYPHRWVTESGNQENGVGTFGRKAQRKVVVQALQALVNTNQQIRDEESRVFNLIACPGYPELIGELVSLNYDRGLTAFVVGDTPARLTSDATSLNNWGKNTAGAVEDNDTGLVSSDEYLGIFYPWGYTSDNFGNNIVVPPSHMMLRTIALSDQVSYPWFAPAGTRRGGITNATAVGYVTTEGEFQSVALNTGQRDTLADSKINPLTFITGTGLVNYGQYTRARNASSLDRINVARLVIYLRRQFALLAKPYVFEPNDKITRDELKGAAESLLLELVGQRALYDYIVVCDTSNNTPARIDRNELYLDVAIEPVKAVEFIYIPLRLKNTGEIAGLTQ
jgi:hypothetical protein